MFNKRNVVGMIVVMVAVKIIFGQERKTSNIEKPENEKPRIEIELKNVHWIILIYLRCLEVLVVLITAGKLLFL